MFKDFQTLEEIGLNIPNQKVPTLVTNRKLLLWEEQFGIRYEKLQQVCKTKVCKENDLCLERVQKVKKKVNLANNQMKSSLLRIKQCEQDEGPTVGTERRT